jgi:hypothetical protein
MKKAIAPIGSFRTSFVGLAIWEEKYYSLSIKRRKDKFNSILCIKLGVKYLLTLNLTPVITIFQHTHIT